jgi:N-acetylglutamate synthase/N-acetylornithine aminotransferase
MFENILKCAWKENGVLSRCQIIQSLNSVRVDGQVVTEGNTVLLFSCEVDRGLLQTESKERLYNFDDVCCSFCRTHFLQIAALLTACCLLFCQV